MKNMFGITPMREFKYKYIPPELQKEFELTKHFLIIVSMVLGLLIELVIIINFKDFGVI